jgi:hypothetical protein
MNNHPPLINPAQPMKKTVLTLGAIFTFALFVHAQTNDFDSKFRFGLRVTPQPTWYTSGDKNNVPSGAKFGLGFGLNIERRFSEVAGLLTGIGGDFEGGKYTFRNDPATNYEAIYWMDQQNEFVASNKKVGNTGYVLKERTIKTTHITIPVILKLSTKEYSGLKYFGMFGGEVGIRVKAIATDSYVESRKYVNDTLFTVVPGETSITAININKESSLIPMRLGLNAGLGAEYRIAGSTSAFVSINYFRSFTNQMRKESDYIIYKTDPASGKSTPIKQNLKLTAIRINIGIMF